MLLTRDTNVLEGSQDLTIHSVEVVATKQEYCSCGVDLILPVVTLKVVTVNLIGFMLSVLPSQKGSLSEVCASQYRSIQLPISMNVTSCH